MAWRQEREESPGSSLARSRSLLPLPFHTPNRRFGFGFPSSSHTDRKDETYVADQSRIHGFRYIHHVFNDKGVHGYFVRRPPKVRPTRPAQQGSVLLLLPLLLLRLLLLLLFLLLLFEPQRTDVLDGTFPNKLAPIQRQQLRQGYGFSPVPKSRFQRHDVEQQFLHLAAAALELGQQRRGQGAALLVGEPEAGLEVREIKLDRGVGRHQARFENLPDHRHVLGQTQDGLHAKPGGVVWGGGDPVMMRVLSGYYEVI